MKYLFVKLGFVKSPTSDRRWPDNVFISGGNPHLTSRFCGVVLGPTTISKRIELGNNKKLYVINHIWGHKYFGDVSPQC